MNQYETVFILTPVLSDVQMKEQRRKLGIEEIGLSNPEEIYGFLSID